jgi:nitroreductase
MEFFEVVEERHSIRSFARTPIEPEKIQKILETANKAPSAGNLQAYEIYMTIEADHRLALSRAALGQDFIASAPVVLVFCAHPARTAPHYGDRGVRLYALEDAAIACTYAMLAATALGLATSWVGAFDDEAVKRAIGAPDDLLPIVILPVGYAAETAQPTSRRRLDELVHKI